MSCAFQQLDHLSINQAVFILSVYPKCTVIISDLSLYSLRLFGCSGSQSSLLKQIFQHVPCILVSGNCVILTACCFIFTTPIFFYNSSIFMTLCRICLSIYVWQTAKLKSPPLPPLSLYLSLSISLPLSFSPTISYALSSHHSN